MLKILIVDDEAIFRERLISTIEWEYLGFVICGEARNGAEALEKIPQLHPDILLADINMPVMDGLTLAEKINKGQFNTDIVLITGHSEFEYARKAVKSGVADYILKPLDKEELLKSLLKIKERKLASLQQARVLESSRQVLKERFLSTLIERGFHYRQEEIVENLQSFGLSVSSNRFVVSVVEIDNMYEKWENYEDILLYRNAVHNILNEILEAEGRHILFYDSEGRIVSLVEMAGSENEYERIVNSYRRLCRLVAKYFDFTVTVGVGNCCDGFEKVRESYIKASDALQMKFNTGGDRVIEYSGQPPESQSTGFYSSELYEDILVHLRLNKWEEIRENLDEIFRHIKATNLSIDYTRTLSTGLVALCLSYITEMGKGIDEIFGKGFSPFNEVNGIKSLDLLYEWITELYRKTIDYMVTNKSTRSRKIAEEAMEYINSNYSDEDLSVEKVAHHVFVAASHLRFVFKKETGQTVADYITKLRMQKAKELLSEGNKKLSEISESVGYTDSGYFSKCFKKYFGITPSDYKNTAN